MDISESRHQHIWNQHKILRFFDTHIDIFQVKKFLGQNSTICNLKMQMRKNWYILKHFAKSKKLFFCQYLSFSMWFLLKFQKSIKLKPPTVPVLYNNYREEHWPGQYRSVCTQSYTLASTTLKSACQKPPPIEELNIERPTLVFFLAPTKPLLSYG